MSSEEQPPPSEQTLLPAIRRGRVERLTIYEVSEFELDTLERGSPDSIFLNIAIALLSSAISLLVTLLTTTIESMRTFVVFVVCVVVGFVIGVILLILWWRSHSSVSDYIKTIRNRVPPEGTPGFLGGSNYPER